MLRTPSMRSRLRLDQALFLAWIAVLPIMRPFGGALWGYAVPLGDVLYLLVVCAWLLAALTHRARLALHPVYLPLAAYAAALILSTALSRAPQASIAKLLGEMLLLSIVVVTVQIIDSERMLKLSLLAWLIGAAVTVAVGLLSIGLFYGGIRDLNRNIGLTVYGSLPPGDYPRIRALFFNMNMLCNYLIVSLMVALAAQAAGKLRPHAARSLILGICVVALFTLSPGLGGLALAGALWQWSRWRAQRPLLAQGILLLGGLVAAAVLIAATISLTPMANGAGLSLAALEPSSRVMTWRQAAAVMAQQPLFGQGLGLQLPAVYYLNPSGHTELLTDAHNIWLSIGQQAGVLGMLAFAWLSTHLLRSGLPWRAGCAPQAVEIRMALSIAFIGAVLYHGLTGSFEDARHIWLLMGMIAVAAHLPDADILPASGVM